MEQLPLWRDELLGHIEPGKFFPFIVVGNKGYFTMESSPMSNLRNSLSHAKLDFDVMETMLLLATPLDSSSICLQVTQNVAIEPRKHQHVSSSSK